MVGMTQMQTANPRSGRYNSVEEILDGLAAGAVVHTMAGFVIVDRTCTDCDARLPRFGIDGTLDTFPRCSAHAF